jgi:hypothetical protein
MAVSRTHELDICAGPTELDRHQLIELLTVIVSQQGLAGGGHPRMGEPSEAPGRTC